MKTKLKIIFAFILAFAGSSCGSWLEVEPQNDITLEDYWKSKKDIRLALNTSYSQLRGQVNTLFLWGEIRGGFLKDGPDSNTDYERILRLEILEGNDVAKWGGIYKVINYANTVLKYAPTVRSSDLSLGKKELNAYLAEAYFLRSLSYFYLVRTFKDIPFHLEPTDSDDVDIFLEKTPEKEVLAKLIEDLEWAERYIPKNLESAEYNHGFATQAAVQALLADIYLWDEQYDKCIEKCDKIINRSAFVLVEIWDNIFEEGNTVEGIFEIPFDRDRNQKNSLKKVLGETDNPIFTVPEEVMELYRSRDRRKNVTFASLSGGDDGDEATAIINKYYSGSLYNNEDANWIVYRYADILMMKAEALVEKGEFFEAQELVEQIRERAGLGVRVLPEDVERSEDIILEERALEFAYEGKRWFDLLRMAKRNDFKRKDNLIDILTKNVDPGDVPKWRSLLSDPMSYYLPIHFDELEKNLNLKQNPYYE
ncbi:membrane protein [Fulvitalea axinellae]|uniref:Membrane protein n=1 Tax=Fulvitalea axinellae TaxID=1182444 RepID=A0AAU9CKE2_9BACT|nr:membrane protein [Fulvitalea axinellae]